MIKIQFIIIRYADALEKIYMKCRERTRENACWKDSKEMPSIF